MEHKFNALDVIFYSREKAEDAVAQIKEMAHLYEKVTLADINEVADLYTKPADRYYWWTENMLKHTEIRRVRNGWIIELIDPIVDRDSIEKVKNDNAPAKVSYRYYTPKKSLPKITPEPITITINTETVDSVEEVMADVFKYAYTITDRPVYISII